MNWKQRLLCVFRRAKSFANTYAMLGFLTASNAALADGRWVHAVAPLWPGYTSADGSGLYWELLRKISVSHGFGFVYEILPLEEAIQAVESQNAHVVIGVTSKTNRYMNLSKRSLGKDSAMVAWKMQKTTWKGLPSLKGKSVAVPKGFFTDSERPTGIQWLIFDPVHIYQLLSMGKADAVLDYSPTMKSAFQTQKLREKGFVMSALPEFDLIYRCGFSTDDVGDDLLKWFDKDFENLIKSGEWDKMRQEVEDND